MIVVNLTSSNLGSNYRDMADNATVNHTVLEAGYVEEVEEELFDLLYQSLVYLLALLIAGDLICGKIIKIVPPLVGQIFVGMLLGPHGLNFISESMTKCWPILGEVGLVLMLCQAGLEMDFHVLKQVGPRGAFMALVGSILPTTIGFLLAYFVLDLSIESALAVGCSFGPTSAGIALNVLQPCHVLNTPLGQLIVAIAIVDDIIALVVLSQLQALTGEGTAAIASIVIPIVSALLWLFVGGASALYVMPRIFNKLQEWEGIIFHKLYRDSDQDDAAAKEADESDNQHQKHLSAMNLTHVIILLFALLPATYYSQASHLLGAFLTGLSACQQPNAADKYNAELDKIIAWLLRIFFGASIAFVIPIQLFRDGTVIATGFLLSLSLLGKIMTGLLFTPVHLQSQQQALQEEASLQQVDPIHQTDESRESLSSTDENRPTTSNATQLTNRHGYDRLHIRDCLVVGFSMAGEAEFAMLVAGFGYNEGLLEEEIYASTVFAIILSTILSPCLLRFTLAFSAKREYGK